MAKNIIEGTARRLLPVSEMARRRLEKCDGCEFQTWLTLSEYIAWLAKHGLEVSANFTQLEALPDLPKKEHRPLAGRYCMRCKCGLEGKARVVEAQCTEGFWKGLESVPTDDERKRQWNICRNCIDNRLDNIRGVCRLARGLWPTRSKQPPPPREVTLSSGETLILREMTGDCLADKWALTDP